MLVAKCLEKPSIQPTQCGWYWDTGIVSVGIPQYAETQRPFSASHPFLPLTPFSSALPFSTWSSAPGCTVFSPPPSPLTSCTSTKTSQMSGTSWRSCLLEKTALLPPQVKNFPHLLLNQGRGPVGMQRRPRGQEETYPAHFSAHDKKNVWHVTNTQQVHTGYPQRVPLHYSQNHRIV